MSKKKEAESGVVKPTNPAGRLTLPPMEPTSTAPAPAPPQPAPPAAPETGNSLEKANPRENPRESPRTLEGTPRLFPRNGDTGGWDFDETDSEFDMFGNPEDNLLGKRGKHPRQESDQYNVNVRVFLQDAVRLAAHKKGKRPGELTDFLLEVALRNFAPEAIERAYARRCEINNVPNDWK